MPGYMFREPSLRDELWGGLGLIVVESEQTRPPGQSPRQPRYHDAHELIARAKQTRLELERHQEWLRAIQGSASWRLTAPLRAAARDGKADPRRRHGTMTPQIALVAGEVYPLSGGGIGGHVGALAQLLEGRAEVTVVTTAEHEPRYRELQGDPSLPRARALRVRACARPRRHRQLLRVDAPVERARLRGAPAAVFPRATACWWRFPTTSAKPPSSRRAAGATWRSCAGPVWRCARTPRRRCARFSTASWATTGRPGRPSSSSGSPSAMPTSCCGRVGTSCAPTASCTAADGLAPAVRLPECLRPRPIVRTSARRPGSTDVLRLLYFGRLERRKGVQNLMRAVTSLMRDDWHLTLVGRGHRDSSPGWIGRASSWS